MGDQPFESRGYRFRSDNSSKPAASGRSSNGDPKAQFLLEIAAQELAERLSVVERHFDKAVELHGYTGLTARFLAETGKISDIERVETDAAFARAAGEAVSVASLETVPLPPESANLIVSPLSLHLTNDTPGVFIQIRRALKPDGLFLAAIPGSGTLAGTARSSACSRKPN